jgi:cytochrome c biogenesis protein ResB
MNRIRRILGLYALAAMAALAVLSILGAFLGAERARFLFNSTPLMVFWCVSLALLVGGLAAFRRLQRSPGLLAAHAGAAIVLVGGMLGSPAVQRLIAGWSGLPRILDGMVAVRQGQRESLVIDSVGRPLGKLPFVLELHRFEIRYDDASSPAQAGFAFRPAPSDYVSDVSVIENSRTVARASIRPNHPLHFGGYHIYQMGWSMDLVSGDGQRQAVPVTILKIRCDAGVNVAFAGLGLVLGGMAWAYWGSPLLGRWKRGRRHDPGA